jgi:hypothetical protein
MTEAESGVCAGDSVYTFLGLHDSYTGTKKIINYVCFDGMLYVKVFFYTLIKFIECEKNISLHKDRN